MKINENQGTVWKYMKINENVMKITKNLIQNMFKMPFKLSICLFLAFAYMEYTQPVAPAGPFTAFGGL